MQPATGSAHEAPGDRVQTVIADGKSRAPEATYQKGATNTTSTYQNPKWRGTEANAQRRSPCHGSSAKPRKESEREKPRKPRTRSSAMLTGQRTLSKLGSWWGTNVTDRRLPPMPPQVVIWGSMSGRSGIDSLQSSLRLWRPWGGRGRHKYQKRACERSLRCKNSQHDVSPSGHFRVRKDEARQSEAAKGHQQR